MLTTLFNDIIETKNADKWRKNNFLSIYMNNGDIQNCTKYL